MFESYGSTEPWFTVKAGRTKWGPARICCGPSVFDSKLLEKGAHNATPGSAGWDRPGKVDLENRIRTRIDLHRLESLSEINKPECDKDKYEMQF